MVRAIRRNVKWDRCTNLKAIKKTCEIFTCIKNGFINEALTPLEAIISCESAYNRNN